MRENIINDILKWIEKHIEDKIRIDDIVQISGYKRRNIQLLFKECTGLSLGSYIRGRRLSRSAMLLRVTNQSITDIAVRLRFDSQASFNREFRKYFGCTPGEYRSSPTWDLRKLRARLSVNNDVDLLPAFCVLENATFYGYTVTYKEKLRAERPCADACKIRFSLVVNNLRIYRQTLFVFSGFSPALMNDDTINVESFFAFERDLGAEQRGENSAHNSKYSVRGCHDTQGGLYVRFSYKGCWDEFSLLSRKIYTELLPKYGLNRRKGEDIEIFYYNDTVKNGDNDILIECDYLIPIDD